MKYAKISLLILIPALASLILGALIYGIASHYTGLFSHDIFEGHTAKSMIPFIGVISGVLGFMPCLFYMANLLYKLKPIPEQAREEIEAILTSEPGFTVGQVFHSLESNCKFRVKAIKNTLFAEIETSNYNHLLNFSL